MEWRILNVPCKSKLWRSNPFRAGDWRSQQTSVTHTWVPHRSRLSATAFWFKRTDRHVWGDLWPLSAWEQVNTMTSIRQAGRNCNDAQNMIPFKKQTHTHTHTHIHTHTHTHTHTTIQTFAISKESFLKKTLLLKAALIWSKHCKSSDIVKY